MPRTRAHALVLAGLLAAATAGCTLSSDPASDSVGRMRRANAAHAEEGVTLLARDASAPTIEVTAPADKVRFEPAKLSADSGVVNIRFETEGNHNFLLVGVGVIEPLLWGNKFGAPVDVTHAVDLAAGEYQFYCSVPGHKEAGMRGVLTVK